MSFIDNFLDCLSTTVTIATRASHDKYGAPSFGSASTFEARIVNKPSWVRVNDNETIEVRDVVWVASTSVINASDQITLPGGATPPIVMAETFRDENGITHNKLHLGF